MNAQQAAVGLLARREHSALELRRKLGDKGWQAAEIDAALRWCQQHDLQSDQRFTESYINLRKGRGYGPLRIAAELKQRGIEETVYAEFLNANNASWQAILREVYQKKYRGELPETATERARQIRFLQHRGFTLENILEVINESKKLINTV